MAAQWAQSVFDTAYRTNNLLMVSMYFGSFVFLSIFLLALIGGLVWEVFTIGISFCSTI
jgi:two pore calcium channel protein 1/two pore calcium channel protein 3